MKAPDNKPRILVSACLLGERVRYDGGDKQNSVILNELYAIAEVLPFCPECAAGLGIPRPPIKVVISENRKSLVQVDTPSIDVTDRMTQALKNNHNLLTSIDGAVLKARSPSCGIIDTPHFRNKLHKHTEETGSGAFAHHLIEFGIPLIDENDFSDPGLRQAFIHKVLGRLT